MSVLRLEGVERSASMYCISLSVFRRGKRKTRGRVRTSKAPWGVQNIMTMNRCLYGGKEPAMLSLQLRDGDYLTIGNDIVIQVFT